MRMEHSFWVLLHPAEDLPDVWIGHCLDLDVVTQGEGFEGAAKAIVEAVVLTMSDDAQNGRDPQDRSGAPEADWSRLYELMRDPGRISVSSVPRDQRDKLSLVAAQVMVQVAHESAPKSEKLSPEPWMFAKGRKSLAPSAMA